MVYNGNNKTRNDMKAEIVQIDTQLEQENITNKEAQKQLCDLFSVIDCFDIDGTELSFKEQLELRMIMSTGKVKIKIVL